MVRSRRRRVNDTEVIASTRRATKRVTRKTTETMQLEQVAWTWMASRTKESQDVEAAKGEGARGPFRSFETLAGICRGAELSPPQWLVLFLSPQVWMCKYLR